MAQMWTHMHDFIFNKNSNNFKQREQLYDIYI